MRLPVPAKVSSQAPLGQRSTAGRSGPGVTSGFSARCVVLVLRSLLCATLLTHSVHAFAEKEETQRSSAKKKHAPTQPKKSQKKSQPAKKRVPAATLEPTHTASAEELKAQREELRARLQRLKQEIAKSETHRSEAADALAQTEQAISDTNRQLRQLSLQQRDTTLQLNQLHGQQQQTRSTQQQQRDQLSALLRQRYMDGAPNGVRLFLSGDNPNHVQRDLQYLNYVAQAQTSLLQNLQRTATQLDRLEYDTRTKQTELIQIQREQEMQKQKLLKETNQRRQMLTEISSKIKAQRREAGALARDEKRLSTLVSQIARVLEQQREQQRAEQKQKTTRPPENTSASHAGRDKERQDAVVAHNDRLPGGDLDGAFEKLKGRLSLPLRGDVIGKFGAPRAEGGPSWKGLFIRALNGSEVHAIANGRVVFSEWLRGFGNLLIIDHGSQYLSIYGNNEALFKETGDRVKAGEIIASVGNSGGNPETGLYFELRHGGQPFDPMRWVSLK